MSLSPEQRKNLFRLSLTDQMLDAIELISDNYGITNRELTNYFRKEERDEGNTRTNVIKPMLLAGVIYQKAPIKRLYPNKLTFIRNELEILDFIGSALPGRIAYYKKRKLKELGDYRKKQVEHAKIELGDVKPPLGLQRANHYLVSFLRLNNWVEKTREEIIMAEENGSSIEDAPIPRCNFCRRKIALEKIRQRAHDPISWQIDELLEPRY
jgi:hypothetical protein